MFLSIFVLNFNFSKKKSCRRLLGLHFPCSEFSLILDGFWNISTEVRVFKLKLGVQLWCFISMIFNSTIHSIFVLNFGFGQHESCRLMLGLYFSYWRFCLVLARFWFTKLWILRIFTEKLNFQLSSKWVDFQIEFLSIFFHSSSKYVKIKVSEFLIVYNFC